MSYGNFIIPVNGLAPGKTVFEWSAGKAFFEDFGNGEILDAKLTVRAEAEKSGKYLGIDCTISGTLSVSCDRCLGDIEMPVDTTVRLSVKYGNAETDEDRNDGDREVVFLDGSDTDLDLSQIVYDYSCLALPIRRVHPDGKCDPAVAGRIGKMPEEAAREENPFAALRGMFGK